MVIVMDVLQGKVLVVGTGISGIAAVKLLSHTDAQIILLDGNDRVRKEDIRKKLPEDIEVQIVIGDPEDELLDTISLAVLSPGVPLDVPFVIKMQEKKIPIWGEIELAYRMGKGKLAAITGTNGKTTTTALTGEILKTWYHSVYVVGNIGLPYTEYAREMTESTVTVAEVSSFQLETTDTFCPDVSAVLNITEDHLNRHHTMENYTNIKLSIAKKQSKEQIIVLNYEDERLRAAAGTLSAKVFYFSSERELSEGIYLDEEQNFVIHLGEDTIQVCHVSDLQILGKHNYENVMAAIAISYFMGVPVDCIKKGVMAFQAVEHRIEFVAEKRGVKYYNDSKGTNPDAAIKAIEAMVSPTVLIGGGYDKKSSYGEWVDAFGDTVKCLVLIGETKDKIAAVAKEKGFYNIHMADSLEAAVQIARQQAKSGDAVLLSPACASWDMFSGYEERGNLFKEYVNALPDGV